jgi:hypothetical protein
VTGLRLGTRAAGQDHEDVLSLLGEAGRDGAEVAKDFARLLPLKTRAEYEPAEQRGGPNYWPLSTAPNASSTMRT